MTDKLTTNGRATVSVLMVRHVLDLIELRGFDTAPLMASAGISRHQLSDASGRVPLALAEIMIEEGIRRTGKDRFGLELSRESFPPRHELLMFLRQACTDLHHLLEMSSRYDHMVSDAIVSPLMPEPGGVTWVFEFHSSNPLIVSQVTDFALGFRYEFLDGFDMPRSRFVKAVRLTRAAPDTQSELDTYLERFDCPVLFDQLVNGISLSTEGLRQPVASTPIIGSVATSQVDDEQGNDRVNRVRAAMRRMISEGRPSRVRLAGELGISCRQLHRELAQAGTGYRELFNDLRLEMARDYLQNTDLQLGDIAERLCFGEKPSFIRWFRQQERQTPGAYREQTQRNAAGR